MNAATLLSFSAALLQLGMALVFLVIAQAPGWRRARLFAVIALSAGCYSAVDIVFAMPGIPLETIRLVGVINYFFASVHCAAWVWFATSDDDHRWSSLPRLPRLLILLALLVGCAALRPDLFLRHELHAVDVPWLGVVYNQGVTTPVADLAGVFLALTLLVPFTRILGELRRGVPGARGRTLGFTVFYASAVIEVLVTNDVITFPYTADLGFLAIVATVLAETVRRVIADARTLDRLGRQLAVEVDDRTRERDVARDALVHAERLAALGRFAAGVGHEINNPLMFVRANLDLLREGAAAGAPREDTLELLDESVVGCERITRVVADLRAYALPAVDRDADVDLVATIEGARKLVTHELRHQVEIITELGTLPLVRGDATRLTQVFVNLLANAGQAIAAAQRQRPRIVLRGAVRDGAVVIEIEDNGVGVPAEALRRLGEPYFSTRVSQGGTGLGLFVVRGIVEALGGTLTFTSEVGVGTCARVMLPCAAPVAPADEPALGTPSPDAPRARVLIVDDDHDVALAAARLLRGVDTELAASGPAALARLGDDADFDAILCDIVMPGMSGLELRDELRRRHPRLAERLVFMTGGATLPEVAAVLRRPDVRHIQKPFDRRTLRAALAEVLALGQPIR